MRQTDQPRAYLNRLGTAVPRHDAHRRYLAWAETQLEGPRERRLLGRMVERAGIEHRWTIFPEVEEASGPTASEFYRDGAAAVPTSARMAAYAEAAPELAVAAVDALGRPARITHLVLASCTGFMAPGVDQIVAARLGLGPTVERTLVGFMGCYAGVAALRNAYHIVRSQPEARVLVITVEVCSVHLQPQSSLEPILAGLLFGDGAAAALVTAEPQGLELLAPFSETLPESDALITWSIGDTGFRMFLSGEVPARIGAAVATPAFRQRVGDVAAIDCWAVHAGGRTILDAVERGLGLGHEALSHSRDVLRDCGNMSSATLLFVLERILASGEAVADGLAIAFGPGLAAEGFRFRSA
ncbi:MAG: type III polyketide synthase [Novosphingobium sp.]|nr:type III polyketide synthase [Novosphingobium sp.]